MILHLDQALPGQDVLSIYFFLMTTLTRITVMMVTYVLVHTVQQSLTPPPPEK
jgi:hypothetical protein